MNQYESQKHASLQVLFSSGEQRGPNPQKFPRRYKGNMVFYSGHKEQTVGLLSLLWMGPRTQLQRQACVQDTQEPRSFYYGEVLEKSTSSLKK